MTACRATVSLEGMLRAAAPSPVPAAKTPATESAVPGRWRIVAADGSRDDCPGPAPQLTPQRGGRSAGDQPRPRAEEYARLAAGLEVMAAVGLSLPEQAKPKLAMPRGTPDAGEILAAASVVAPPPEPAVDAGRAEVPQPIAANRRGCRPSGACRRQRPELRVEPVVEAWPRLPHGIQTAILAVVAAALN